MSNPFEELTDDSEPQHRYRRNHSTQPIGIGQLLGLFGALLLAIGTFLPAINVPIFGGFTFMQVSHKFIIDDGNETNKEGTTNSNIMKNKLKSGIPVEGTIVLIMSLCGLIFTILKQGTFLWGTGLICIILIVSTYIRLDEILSIQQQSAVKNNSAIGIVMISTVSYGVSWIVLGIGCFLTICSAGFSHTRQQM